MCMVLFVPILLKYEVVIILRFTVLNRCEGYRYSNTKGIRFSFHYKVSNLFALLSPVHIQTWVLFSVLTNISDIGLPAVHIATFNPLA
jgi:hypothetical protein